MHLRNDFIPKSSNFRSGKTDENCISPSSTLSRTISSTKYQVVDDGSKYGVMTGNGMEEIKYVTSSCSMDDPSKVPYGSSTNGMTPTSVVSNGGGGQVQMNQNGNGQSGNVIMVGSCSSGGEEESLSQQQQQQQHQVKTEDNSHSYVLPPFLH